MSWFYERKTVTSEKNGAIACRRFFGRWEVFVDGYHASSRYLVSVWRDAYARLPSDFVARDVLMFGLAAGDNVTLLARRFPGCRVTAVEWDPVMARLADECGLFPANCRPEVIVADARDAAVTLGGTYDLILVDIFRGRRLADAAFAETFLARLPRLLRPDGAVIANAFWQPEFLAALGRHLGKDVTWTSRNNRMGIFSHSSAGEGKR